LLSLWLLAGGAEAGLRQPVPAAVVLAGAEELTGRDCLVRLANLPRVRLAAEAAGGKAGGPGEEALAGVVVVRLPAPAADRALPAVAFPADRVAQAAAQLGITGWARWRDGDPEHPLGNILLIFGDGSQTPQEMARRWRTWTDVLFAEPYFVFRTCLVPDDPLVASQEHLPAVNAFAAWDLQLGEQNPVLVAVVDGGVQIDHPDLAANVAVNQADPPDGIDNDNNGFVDDTLGWNFGTGEGDPGALQETTPLAVRHGTHVAGIVSAVSDNGFAVAGVTWNNPVLCVAANHPTVDDWVLYGFQGILYAAERGARVINCSWGRVGLASLLEVAVLDHLAGLGVVVIAAAGNWNSSFPFYPAAYENVFAVANVDSGGVRSPSSNFGLWVDLAAPGVHVLSLFPDDQVGYLSGTSMASPVAAGLASLLWGAEPALALEALQHRLRVSCGALDELNPDFAGMLGSGLVDGPAALTYQGPGYRLVEAAVTDADGDGYCEPGETIDLDPRWQNVLQAGSGAVTVTLTVAGDLAAVLQGEASLIPLASGQSGRCDGSFRIAVHPATPAGTELSLVWALTGSGADADYRDRQVFRLVVSPLFVDLAAGEVKATLCGNGRLGFAGIGGGNGRDGLGVRYQPVGQTQGEGPLGNLLFEGALLVGTDVDHISDAARYSSLGHFERDFVPLTAEVTPRLLPDVRLQGGALLARAGAEFVDSQAIYPLPILVRWQLLSPPAGQGATGCLLFVSVVNQGAATLDDLHYGFFLDWDLNGGGFFPAFRNNTTLYQDGDDFASVFRSGEPDGVTVTTTLVAAGLEPTHFRAIDNPSEEELPDSNWGIYDGFWPEEKWDALTDREGPQEAADTDISQFWAAGPVSLAAGDSVRFVLVLSAGQGVDQAAANVLVAAQLAEQVLAEQVWGPPELPFQVGLPAPNPWNERVRIPVFGNPLVPWHLLVYDLRGRLVYRSGPTLQGAEGLLTWDGCDQRGAGVASGLYLLRLGQGDHVVTRKSVLVR